MRIEIQKGWYRSAGDKYHWVQDGFDPRGVGINAKILAQYPKLEVVVDKVVYEVDTQVAIKFVKRYRSYYDAKGTMVGVVSRSLLVAKDMVGPKKPEENQLSLF